MEIQAMQRSYARWAPVYDRTFGAVTNIGRRRAVALLNELGGSVLEVGVGTGMALPHYGPGISVTGIDASAPMLAKAQEKVAQQSLTRVVGLKLMDARALEFADQSFDNVVAMHVVSVVPEPERVLAEMVRVCKPGGTVLIVNHFARKTGALSVVEKLTAPLANLLGWHSDFQIERVLGVAGLRVLSKKTLPPFGMMTLLRLIRE